MLSRSLASLPSTAALATVEATAALATVEGTVAFATVEATAVGAVVQERVGWPKWTIPCALGESAVDAASGSDVSSASVCVVPASAAAAVYEAGPRLMCRVLSCGVAAVLKLAAACDCSFSNCAFPHRHLH